MAADFARVFPGFFEGSLRDTPPWTRLLFLAMISRADQNGVVHGTPGFFAAYLNCTEEEVREALEILSAPDPHSTTPDCEGRRIERWGDGANMWRVVNYQKYYQKGREADRKEYKREHARRRREREREEQGGVDTCRQLWTPVDKVDNVDPENEIDNENDNESEQTRARAREAPPLRDEKTASPSDSRTVPKAERFQNRNCSNGSHPPPAKRLSGDSDSESAAGESGYFERTLREFHAAYPVPAGGMPSHRTLWMAWHDVRLRGEDLAAIVEGAKRYAAFCASEPDRPVKDPRNWLRGREWERPWTTAEDAEDAEFQRLMAEKRAARTPEQQAIYLAKLEEDRRLLEQEGRTR